MVGSSLFLQIIRLVFNIYVSNQIEREALGVFQLIMTAYMFGITLAASRNKHNLNKNNIRRTSCWKQSRNKKINKKMYNYKFIIWFHSLYNILLKCIFYCKNLLP